jgi:hypothetical protein
LSNGNVEMFFKIELTDIKTVVYCTVSLRILYFGNKTYIWGSVTTVEYNVHENIVQFAVLSLLETVE